MAAPLKIKTGTKLALAMDVPSGKEPDFNMVCTFDKALNEVAFLVSIPMKNGKRLEISGDQKLLIRYGTGAEQMIIAGYVDDTVKQGLRYYWKIRRVTEQRQFFQRSEERVKTTMHVGYSQPTWPANIDGVIEPEDALTLDISVGGVALYMNHAFAIGEVCDVFLPQMGTTKAGAKLSLPAENCWTRKAERGSPFKNICGLKFRFADEREKKRLNDYIAVIKKYSNAK